jgi:hypothetical protein
MGGSAALAKTTRKKTSVPATKAPSTQVTSGQQIAAKGVAITVPAVWGAFSIDDPRLDEALKIAKKQNPQLTLTPESMKASGIVILAVNKKPKDPAFVDNVNVVVVDNGPKSLKGFDAEYKKVLESQGAIVTSQNHSTVAGLDALVTKYELELNAPNGKKIKAVGTQVVVVKRGQVFVMTISLSSADEVVVDSLTKSFQVT